MFLNSCGDEEQLIRFPQLENSIRIIQEKAVFEKN